MKNKLSQSLQKLLERGGFVRGALNRNDRAGALHRAWGHVFTSHIDGDYVEFGVYKGDSFIESFRQHARFARWLQGQMNSTEEWRRSVAGNFIGSSAHFHGLDTFSGMPANSERNPTFAQGTFLASRNEVEARCRSAGMTNFSLYEGKFSATAPALAERLSPKVAVVNIDCDLHSSAVDALAAIRDRLQVGSVILFDDWNAHCADNNRGERRAFREFRSATSLEFEPWFAYQYSGQAFLCVE